MVLDCLKDYIGIKGVHITSTIFINDCFGISTESIEAIKKDNENIIEFWDSIQNFAFNQFKNNLIIHITTLFQDAGTQVRNQVQKNIETIICNNIAVLSEFWVNIIATNTLKNRKYSDNINFHTTVDLENLKELLEDYEKQKELILKNIIPIALEMPEFFTHKDEKGQYITRTYILP